MYYHFFLNWMYQFIALKKSEIHKEGLNKKSAVLYEVFQIIYYIKEQHVSFLKKLQLSSV